ncbi:MAG: hypothetical protein M1358_18855 [Chloroflexi bacterium]|nr:hypothetical protein [Chloroflexota bacterium]
MPELPEAQVLADDLRKRTVGQRIVEVDAGQPKGLNLPLEEFKRKAQGRVRGVTRRAKSVVIELEDDGSLWLHMGLRSVAGWLRLPTSPPGAFLKLEFDHGRSFYMNKTFMGKAHFVAPEERDRRWNDFGVEPLAPEFTLDRFRQILSSRPGAAIKALLMDQERIAGIGNIYSDEILFVARVRPDRQISTLTDAEIEGLFKAIRQVLAEAVEKGGGPEWVDLEGKPGGYVPRVHGATSCPECGGDQVTKITFGGRTAYVCEKCQR